MKILVLSDSHGNLDNMVRAIEHFRPDRVIHLGDGYRELDELKRMFFHVPICGVGGNCDRDITAPETYIDEIGGVRVFACHGHRYSVKTGFMPLYYAALERGARIALYGHTHAAHNETLRDLHFFNPGSCSGMRPSCGLITIENGSYTCEIHRISELGG